MRKIVGWVLLAAGLGTPLASASSPEPPVRAELRPVGGRSALELRVAAREAKDGNAYTVKVKSAGVPSAPEKQVSEIVTAARPLVQEVMVRAGDGKVARVRYELEITSADGRYHGFLVIDQAFVGGPDGGLKPIDFAEEMRLQAGKPPVKLSSDQKAAGGNAPRPSND
jgi:hypothetical protein